MSSIINSTDIKGALRRKQRGFLLSPYRYTPPPGADPNYANRLLGLHMNGANGSTTFTDNSPTPKTVTVFGNAQISTAQSKFNGSSGLFDATGDNIRFVNGGVFDFGTSTFTVSGFARPNAATFSGVKWLISTRSISGNDNGIYMYVSATGKLTAAALSDAVANSIASTTTGVSANTWFHWEYTYDGTTYRLFHDGGLVGSLTRTVIPGNSNGSCWVGSSSLEDGTRDWPGHLAEVLVYKGVCLHTAAFTPPTAAFSDF